MHESGSAVGGGVEMGVYRRALEGSGGRVMLTAQDDTKDATLVSPC